MADFENSHSSKDLRKREKRMPKIENTIQIADTGESIMRIGKPSSSMEDKSIFLTSSAFKCHSHREMKVTSQSYGKENLEKKISSLPMSHSKRMQTMVVDMQLFEIESCQELKRDLKKMSRHEENLLILKKFLKVRKEKEHNDQGVFFATSFSLSNDVSCVEERVKQMATILAMVTLRQWMLNGWKDLETLAKCAKKSHIYNALQDSVFKSLAKFILSIFDTEDLERLNFYDRIVSENKRFYHEKLLPLPPKDCDDPVKLIEGKITLDGFPLLTEYDMVQKYNSDFIVRIRKWTPVVVVEFMNFVTMKLKAVASRKDAHRRYVECVQNCDASVCSFEAVNYLVLLHLFSVWYIFDPFELIHHAKNLYAHVFGSIYSFPNLCLHAFSHRKPKCMQLWRMVYLPQLLALQTAIALLKLCGILVYRILRSILTSADLKDIFEEVSLENKKLFNAFSGRL
ncbi:uncharacterized protein LOC111277630 [Durio zibethinus]|uniref:Uncharacterized protein LOC111277630 n=1 Tax=Durio zibethinus TaxID=66656 RepID=A0A6P5WUI4_DURZI|nr:uncharacterized protein LOC111277630 [Durio zibethinus]